MTRIQSSPPAVHSAARSSPTKPSEAPSPQESSAKGFEAQYMKDAFETRPAGTGGTSPGQGLHRTQNAEVQNPEIEANMAELEAKMVEEMRWQAEITSQALRAKNMKDTQESLLNTPTIK